MIPIVGIVEERKGEMENHCWNAEDSEEQHICHRNRTHICSENSENHWLSIWFHLDDSSKKKVRPSADGQRSRRDFFILHPPYLVIFTFFWIVIRRFRMSILVWFSFLRFPFAVTLACGFFPIGLCKLCFCDDCVRSKVDFGIFGWTSSRWELRATKSEVFPSVGSPASKKGRRREELKMGRTAEVWGDSTRKIHFDRRAMRAGKGRRDKVWFDSSVARNGEFRCWQRISHSPDSIGKGCRSRGGNITSNHTKWRWRSQIEQWGAHMRPWQFKMQSFLVKNRRTNKRLHTVSKRLAEVVAVEKIFEKTQSSRELKKRFGNMQEKTVRIVSRKAIDIDVGAKCHVQWPRLFLFCTDGVEWEKSFVQIRENSSHEDGDHMKGGRGLTNRVEQCWWIQAFSIVGVELFDWMPLQTWPQSISGRRRFSGEVKGRNFPWSACNWWRRRAIQAKIKRDENSGKSLNGRRSGREEANSKEAVHRPNSSEDNFLSVDLIRCDGDYMRNWSCERSLLRKQIQWMRSNFRRIWNFARENELPKGREHKTQRNGANIHFSLAWKLEWERGNGWCFLWVDKQEGRNLDFMRLRNLAQWSRSLEWFRANQISKPRQNLSNEVERTLNIFTLKEFGVVRKRCWEKEWERNRHNDGGGIQIQANVEESARIVDPREKSDDESKLKVFTQIGGVHPNWDSPMVKSIGFQRWWGSSKGSRRMCETNLRNNGKRRKVFVMIKRGLPKWRWDGWRRKGRDACQRFLGDFSLIMNKMNSEENINKKFLKDDPQHSEHVESDRSEVFWRSIWTCSNMHTELNLEVDHIRHVARESGTTWNYFVVQKTWTMCFDFDRLLIEDCNRKN